MPVWIARTHRLTGAGLIAALLVALTAGCSAQAPGSGPAVDGDAGELSAETYRTRFDPARDGIQVSVTNGGTTALTVVRTELRSDAFAGEISSERVVNIPAGMRRDIPLTLPRASCDAEPQLATSQVELAVRPEPESTPIILTMSADDRLGQLATWWHETCLAEEVANRVDLAVTLTPTSGSRSDAIGLELIVSPRTNAEGTAPLTITAIDSTILLTMTDSEGASVSTLPIGITVDAEESAPRRTDIVATPARCDTHAIAEDKQGTLFRLHVAIGDRAGTVTVAASAGVRNDIYAAIQESCARAGRAG